MELNNGKNRNLITNFINNNKMEKLTFWILINIFYILVGSYLNTIHSISQDYFANGLIPLLVINIVISIIICKKGYYKKNIVYLFIALIILFGIISTIYAVNQEVSIFGYTQRREGLLTIIYYFSLMFLSSFVKGKNKKAIILFILITGIINCIYGIFECFGQPNVSKIIHSSENPNDIKIKYYVWVKGFLGNPNFFGTYMLVCLSYALGLFIEEINKKSDIIYILLSALFMYGLLICNTQSVILGLFFVIALVIIYCLKNKKYKKLVLIFAILLCSILLAVIQGKTTLLKDLSATSSETVEIAKGNVQDDYGTNRLYIWRNTLQIIPQNIINGVGIDNFPYAFNEGALYSPGKNTLYDKVHNEYLQVLVTEGIFCLLAYLCMYSIIVYKGLKNSFKNKQIYLILPIVGYLVQAFFNISVIEVAPIFFIAMGLCVEDE